MILFWHSKIQKAKYIGLKGYGNIKLGIRHAFDDFYINKSTRNVCFKFFSIHIEIRLFFFCSVMLDNFELERVKKSQAYIASIFMIFINAKTYT